MSGPIIVIKQLLDLIYHSIGLYSFRPFGQMNFSDHNICFVYALTVCLYDDILSSCSKLTANRLPPQLYPADFFVTLIFPISLFISFSFHDTLK